MKETERVVLDLSGGNAAEEKWLTRSRYGELLYQEYRCMWIHEFQPSRKLGNAFDPAEESEPDYQNLMADMQRVIAIARPTTVIAPVPFDRHPDHSATAQMTAMRIKK